ncbi:hypothetical protein OC25_24695 [Pedobacter kyungheensis]|uniref:Uncharacterized protein n=1 Tax=Pedobacter kyungheensis TaxID=1069985 RepID=A0A0C1FET5_9SPHI|nr:hypothetical protein [Pedobacter kyungheensis]KIA90323.1 hypothetical protein OC25_24695 [Pedobacter kyungheensis]
MTNPFGNIDFKLLLEYVKNLSVAQKKELLQVLNQSELHLVNEEEVAYVKTPSTDISFDEQWDESLSVSEFKAEAIKHINSLPWK